MYCPWLSVGTLEVCVSRLWLWSHISPHDLKQTCLINSIYVQKSKSEMKWNGQQWNKSGIIKWPLLNMQMDGDDTGLSLVLPEYMELFWQFPCASTGWGQGVLQLQRVCSLCRLVLRCIMWAHSMGPTSSTAISVSVKSWEPLQPAQGWPEGNISARHSAK